MRRLKLDAKIQETICSFIRAGGFPHIAAEAAGVPRAVFESWLARGQRPEARGNYRSLFLAVEQARAQARLAAEIEVFKADPTAWLKSGPGKETETNPGWTTTVKPKITQDNRTVNLLLAPEMQGLFAAILQILAPYPEARTAVAQALAGKCNPPQLPHNSGK
ncbi:MAG: hypothetical protein JNM56_37655 [Planctomycetia bacterium]|nr:hypothetical protein [Planctomycetia bacterium]